MSYVQIILVENYNLKTTVCWGWEKQKAIDVKCLMLINRKYQISVPGILCRY